MQEMIRDGLEETWLDCSIFEAERGAATPHVVGHPHRSEEELEAKTARNQPSAPDRSPVDANQDVVLEDSPGPVGGRHGDDVVLDVCVRGLRGGVGG